MDRMNRPRAYSSNIGLCLVISIDWEFRTALLYDELTDTDPEYSFDELQFLWPTGLKDKNGQEIYEGDIIKCDISMHISGTLPHMGEVIYIDRLCSFATKNDGGETLFAKHVPGSREVIGNKFENKELLED